MSTSARRVTGVLLALAGVALAVYGWRAVQDSDWAEPVVHYIIFEGLPGTLKVSLGAVVGSVVIGTVLILSILITNFLQHRRGSDG